MTTSQLQQANARKILGLTDLTSLNATDDEAAVRRLCRRACGIHGSVAAVCVWPRFVALARQELAGSGVKVAAVANFPAGTLDAAAAARETADIVASGGEEVDVVFPYNAWLNGETARAIDLVAACRQAAGRGTRLKVILETGCLRDEPAIRDAALAAIEAGADFIKTSTGKTTVGATTEAARAMLRAIAASGRPVGFKASGGIARLESAMSYLKIADAVMGRGWTGPDRFRFGASSLLNDLFSVLGGEAGRPADAVY